MLVIAVVALLVIGPEKLPRVARTLGMLTGRLQRYVSTVKADIDRELRMDEVRKLEQETRNSIMAAQSGILNDAAQTGAEITEALDIQTPDKPA